MPSVTHDAQDKSLTFSDELKGAIETLQAPLSQQVVSSAILLKKTLFKKKSSFFKTQTSHSRASLHWQGVFFNIQ